MWCGCMRVCTHPYTLHTVSRLVYCVYIMYCMYHMYNNIMYTYAIIHSMYHVCVVYCFHYLLLTSYLNTYLFPFFVHQLINEAFLKDFMEQCTEVMVIKHDMTHQKMMYLYPTKDRH